MDRNNYGSSSSGMRDRGERYTDREQKRSPSQRHGQHGQPDKRRQYEENSRSGPSNNNSTTSLTNSRSNLLQSPFQNPYKIDSNATKTTVVNDPSKDRLEIYAKLKSISPVKFYISIIIAVILTAALAIIGIISLNKNGLAASNIKDVTPGMAQGYLFYCAFLFIAILTGVYAFIKKWNNLLITYLSFLFVSCLYLAYFTIELINIKTNTIEIMNNRWKDDFKDSEKSTIQDQLGCCGYYDSDDDAGKSGDCINNDSLRKRFFNDSFEFTEMSYSSSNLRKRMQPAEGSCAEQIKNVVDKNLPMYIIILGVLLLLNIGAVVVTILDIKQYAIILKELSNPFA